MDYRRNRNTMKRLNILNLKTLVLIEAAEAVIKE